jgi:hypothetical protein
MLETYTESLAAFQSAMAEVERAQEYLDQAKGKEQTDEAIIRLTAARATVDRLIRDIKRERGLKVREYKCPFEYESIKGEKSNEEC